MCACVQLEELSVTAEDSEHAWLVGMDSVPKQWVALTRLRKLELRGHRCELQHVA